MTQYSEFSFSQPALLGIIFDIDGVLLNSRNANISYYNLLRDSVGLAPMSLSDEEFCHMATAHQSFERIIPPHQRTLAKERSENISYTDHSLPKLSLYTGVIELLTWLRSWNIGLGVCTNRITHVPLLLRHFGIEHFFSPIKTAANSEPKPNPQGLLNILTEWNVSVERVAFLGDSGVDEEAATAAGIPFWAYGNPKLNARIHVDDFFTLMETIKPLVECKK